MNGCTHTNTHKLENMGSRVRRHEHGVKRSTHPKECTKDSICTCRTGSKFVPKVNSPSFGYYQQVDYSQVLIIFSREPRLSVLSRINYLRLSPLKSPHYILKRPSGGNVLLMFPSFSGSQSEKSNASQLLVNINNFKRGASTKW